MGAMSRLGKVTPSTRNVAAEVVSHLESIGRPLPKHPDTGDQVIWGYDSNPSNTEHHSGRALDFMVTADPAVGDLIADYVWKHRKRLGLKHVIWKQRIKSTSVQPGVWRKMANRGSPTNNHMDHPHVFLSGKTVAARTSNTATTKGTSNKPAKAAARAPKFPLPKGHYFGPKSGPVSSVSGYYSHRADLKKWQARMKKRGWRINPDGLYGPETKRVATAFQREKGLGVDGLIEIKTWRAAWTAEVT